VHSEGHRDQDEPKHITNLGAVEPMAFHTDFRRLLSATVFTSLHCRLLDTLIAFRRRRPPFRLSTKSLVRKLTPYDLQTGKRAVWLKGLSRAPWNVEHGAGQRGAVRRHCCHRRCGTIGRGLAGRSAFESFFFDCPPNGAFLSSMATPASPSVATANMRRVQGAWCHPYL
jgi:hypothetical protein